MASLSDVLNSAATLLQQADETEDAAVKASLQESAHNLLEAVNVKLAPGSIPAPDPIPDPDDDE